jgi:hypothetical protein
MLVVPPSVYPGYDDIYLTAAAPLIKEIVLPDWLVLLRFQDSRNFQSPQLFLTEFDNFPIR